VVRKKRRVRSEKARAKARAWRACSIYIRTKASKDGHCQCVTCKEWNPIKRTDAGHFISKSRGNAIYFEEENINPQCARCNRFHEGNKHMYTLYMIDTYGIEKVHELEALARTRVLFRLNDYLEIEAEYKRLLEEL